MKPVAGEVDLLEFECSGRTLRTWGGVVGIDDAGATFTGYDDRLCVYLRGELDDDALSDDEKHELALHMVRRWLKFAKIETPSEEGAPVVMGYVIKENDPLASVEPEAKPEPAWLHVSTFEVGRWHCTLKWPPLDDEKRVGIIDVSWKPEPGPIASDLTHDELDQYVRGRTAAFEIVRSKLMSHE